MPSMYENELCHYGVMGMHWGIRRYQPYPAAYDGAGKYIGDKALKKKVKADEKDTQMMIEAASVLGDAMRASKRRVDSLSKKANRYLAKDPGKSKQKTVDAVKEFSDAKNTHRRLSTKYKNLEAKVNERIADLRQKYGEENIKDPKYIKDSKVGRLLSSTQGTFKKAFVGYTNNETQKMLKYYSKALGELIALHKTTSLPLQSYRALMSAAYYAARNPAADMRNMPVDDLVKTHKEFVDNARALHDLAMWRNQMNSLQQINQMHRASMHQMGMW